VVLGAICVAIDGLWLDRFRKQGPLSIDEAGYLRFALDDRAGLSGGGLRGLWDAIVSQRQHGPLIPALSVPVQLVIGSRILAAFIVVEGFFVLLVVCAWFVARHFLDRRWALLATVAVATTPEVTYWTRTLYFGVPATALFLAATLALLRSDRLGQWGWSLLFGALLGSAMLARTMMVALVPGLIGAAVFGVLATRDEQGRRLLHLGLAVAVGTAVAATWWGPNWSVITGYLTSYGYGANSADYTFGFHASGPWEPRFWTAQLNAGVDGLGLLLAALLGIAIVLAVATRRHGFSARAVLTSDHAVLAVALLEGYLALTSTSNQTAGYGTPLLPMVVLLGVAAIAALPRRAWRRALAVGVAVVSPLAVLAQAGVVGPLSTDVTASLPGIGTVHVIRASSEVRDYIGTHAHYRVRAPADRLPTRERAWMPTATRSSACFFEQAEAHGRLPVAFFATRDPLFNTNTVSLEARAVLHTSLLVGQVQPASSPTRSRREANYRIQLSDPRYGWPNLLVTGPPAPGEFAPRVAQPEVAAAARATGFAPAFDIRLPDGRIDHVWWHLRGPVDPTVTSGPGRQPFGSRQTTRECRKSPTHT
jgi:Dolichyl-phosphate-mannose-protein mannosyltransferase